MTQPTTTDSDDEEQAEGMADIYAKLRKVIPKVFAAAPDAAVGCEDTSLYNRDVSVSNILLSDSGDLVAIVDWECAIASPSWHSSQFPQFLDGLLASLNSPLEQTPDLLTPEALADEDEDAVAFYELNCLRHFFVEEMQRQCPAWLVQWSEGKKRRDVLVAIEQCNRDDQWGLINGWLDALMEGREPKMGLLEAMWTPIDQDEEENEEESEPGEQLNEEEGSAEEEENEDDWVDEEE
jgi:hypothetical protein